jgi:hypothetical protein
MVRKWASLQAENINLSRCVTAYDRNFDVNFGLGMAPVG